MATSSTARLAASRANARKGGPRTPEGRARSARNATKHGLAGTGIPLLPEDQALLEHRLICWSEELGAVGDLEHEYVAVAAKASVRGRRAEITEADNARDRIAKVRDRLVGRAEVRLAEAERGLVAWEAAVAAKGLSPLTKGDLVQALGERVVPTLEALVSLNVRSFGVGTQEERLALYEEYQAGLRRHLDEAAAEVEARRVELADAEAGVGVPADAWLDGSKQGELLRRYEAAAERIFFRAITSSTVSGPDQSQSISGQDVAYSTETGHVPTEHLRPGQVPATWFPESGTFRTGYPALERFPWNSGRSAACVRTHL